MTEAFEGLSGFRCIVDDFVIYDNNIEDHIVHVKQFLKRCAEKTSVGFFKLRQALLGSYYLWMVAAPLLKLFVDTLYRPVGQNLVPSFAWSISCPQVPILLSHYWHRFVHY